MEWINEPDLLYKATALKYVLCIRMEIYHQLYHVEPKLFRQNKMGVNTKTRHNLSV